jgi:MFS family permease
MVEAGEAESEVIQCSDIKKMRREYWIVASICTAAMSLWIPFMDNVNRMFQKRFCYSQVSAGNVITIAYLIAVVVSVPLGFLVDAFGNRRVLTVAGVFVFFAAQLLMLAYPQCESEPEKGVIAGLVLQGVGYAFYSTVLVASVPLVCKLKCLGTAFGIMELMESFFEFLIPILTGLIVGAAETPEIGYRYSSTLFAGLGIIGLAMSSALFWGIKRHYKKKLDRSSSENLLAVARHKDVPSLASSWSYTSEEALAKKSKSLLM